MGERKLKQDVVVVMKIKREDIIWKTVRYLKKGFSENYEFELTLNEPLASWDVYDYWEKERTLHMRRNLSKGDILFDVGSENGWLNLVYAQFVGPENMVLIEPTPDFWPNIRALWEKSYAKRPLACYHGLFSDKTTSGKITGRQEWPEASNGDLIDKLAYTYIHDNPRKIPEITIDEYVRLSGIVPNAITMDTEGSELLILRGAENTLKQHSPKLWVSIHPDLGERDYGISKADTIRYLNSLGYKGTCLAIDHEEHWYFER